MIALQSDARPSDVSSDKLRADFTAYDFAVATSDGPGILPAPMDRKSSAYFSGTIDTRGVIDPQSLIRPVADVESRAAETAEDGDAVPPTKRGFSMALRNLSGKVWRALRRLQPMFPPMSCC
jgi:hypothetical protein